MGIKPDKFNYDNYLSKTEDIIARTEPFVTGKTKEYLPVFQWHLGDSFGASCRNCEEMLEMQLEAIEQTLEADTDWIPYLEPWHGVGVFAEAFGCPFEWRPDDAPWTHPMVTNIDDLKSLKKPKLEDSKMLQYVLDTIRHFDKATDGQVFITATDTQSPLDTATLIIDTTFFFYAAMDYPEELHRVISDITDLIIEFSMAEREITSRQATPGHNAWAHPKLPGLGLSEDVLYMVGPDFFDEFARPYNERIAKALGGVAIHSCGDWKQNFDIVSKVDGLVSVDLAVHTDNDPNPNTPEAVRDGFRGKDFLVKARFPGQYIDILDRIYAPDFNLMWDMGWNPDPMIRQSYYDNAKRRFEELSSGAKR